MARSPNFVAMIVLSMLIVPVAIAKDKPKLPDWYLVDEVIVDEAPDYRSDIFFADKSSVRNIDGLTSISVSQIVMAETNAGDNEISRIRDIRSTILIDCHKHMYAAMELTEFDGNEKLIRSETQSRAFAKWILPYADSGYVSVFRFACEPDQEFGSQEFPGHIQPLTAFKAYLNADWSK
ncbi:hypothetical protein GCM10009096_08800 [Parasphingorhabdus litoris]|uniref:Surface-adhesin protein E-like domain-containing protein n=1 Tax=Parasphingorhabdus litoris TaxID=394733 RepID=A0ABN1A8H9_9SPHN|nr:surface-adhesin E family protein [Parasphingorhabdus litoris]